MHQPRRWAHGDNLPSQHGLPSQALAPGNGRRVQGRAAATKPQRADIVREYQFELGPQLKSADCALPETQSLLVCIMQSIKGSCIPLACSPAVPCTAAVVNSCCTSSSQLVFLQSSFAQSGVDIIWEETHGARWCADVALAAAVAMLVQPRFFVEPLAPAGLPSYAVASAAATLRVAGSLRLLHSAVWGCLTDAASKGNLVKSATYRRLSSAQWGVSRATLLLLAGSYLFADNLDSPWLGMLIAVPSLVSLWATLEATPAVLFRGRPQLREAGALESSDEEMVSEGADSLQEDMRAFLSGVHPVSHCQAHFASAKGPAHSQDVLGCDEPRLAQLLLACTAHRSI